MKYWKEVVRGLLIGIAGIAPGVSGGALAVSMGVYDRIIGAVTHITSDPWESIKTLFPYGAGAVIGMSGLSFVIEALFARFPFAVSMAFIGLILGGVPALKKKIRREERGLAGYAAFLILFCLMILLVIAEAEQGGENGGLSGAMAGNVPGGLFPALGLLCAGLIGAAATVIPGVSGTMLLMMMGYYQPVLSSFNRFQLSLLTGDLPRALEEQRILLPYGAGLIAGIFLCAHMVESLLKHYESLTYCMILALVLSSPIVILGGTIMERPGMAEGAAGLLLALLCGGLTARTEGQRSV